MASSTTSSALMDGPEMQPTTMDVADIEEEKSVATVGTNITATTYTGRDSQEIRSRLLSRLGIYDASGMASPQPMTAAQHRRVRILRGMGVGYTTFKSPPDGSATRKPLNGVVPSKEPLKSHHDDSKNDKMMDDTNEKTDSKDGSKSKTTRIAFQDHVDVLPIATRHEYSDRIKSRIWSNRHELQENAERNAVEYAAEGWKWKNVIEDEGMYICSASGELVHPAWVGDLKLDHGSTAHSSD